jgi:hypothetical protein
MDKTHFIGSAPSVVIIVYSVVLSTFEIFFNGADVLRSFSV